MEIILHLGAHRTGSTSFQNYLRANADRLEGQSIGFWGPWRTRQGVLHGLTARPETPAAHKRAIGRLRMNLDRTARQGCAVLIVSDENVIGTPRSMVRAASLYPAAGERMARLHGGFGRVSRVVIQIRTLETWWASLLAFLVARGEAVPRAKTLEAIAASSRSWRQVITDIACACPDARLIVMPFERFVGRPDTQLQRAAGILFPPPAGAGAFWDNRSPDLPALRRLLVERGGDPEGFDGEGRWQPFNMDQAARLREAYADDLFWLAAGADGLAQLAQEDDLVGHRKTGTAGWQDRGLNDDGFARELAHPR